VEFTAASAAGTRFMSHEVQETDEEFDARYVAFFSRPDIDGWEIRKVIVDNEIFRKIAQEEVVLIFVMHSYYNCVELNFLNICRE